MADNTEVNKDLARRMNSLELLLIFVCKQMWEHVTDGDDIELELIKAGLIELDIDPDTIFTY